MEYGWMINLTGTLPDGHTPDLTITHHSEYSGRIHPLSVQAGKDTAPMKPHQILTCFLPSLLTGIATLSGCSFYYDSQAEGMVERQIDAMVFVEGGEFMMGNPGGWDG